jgi:glycosyltransferase involved in cell wall biosynthesis
MLRVSVIIPCYNQSLYLNECLNSVYIQTYKNWECIIINDGSEDNTEEIALNWTSKDVRYRYFYKKNGGLSSARNYGLRKANGDVIQFLDSDDLIEKNKLANEVDFLANNEKIDLVYSSAKFFFNDNQEETFLSREKDSSDWTFNRINPQFNFIRSISDWNIMVVSAPLLRKLLCEKVGFFDENLKSLEDWDYWIRCILSGASFHYLNASDDSLTLIRCYAGSMSTNIDVMRESELKVRFKYLNTPIHNEMKYALIKEKLLNRMIRLSRKSRIRALKLVFRHIKFIKCKELIILVKSVLLRKLNVT